MPTNQPPPALECQDCGIILRYLSDREAQEMAYNPYHFIAFCNDCADMQKRIDSYYDGA